MKRLIFSALAVIVAFGSCSEQQKEKNKLDKIDWILGYWEYSTEAGDVTESWIRTDDTTYSGVGKFRDNTGQVVESESIQIVLRDGKLWYIPTVSNQNDGEAIPFEESKFEDSLVVFAKPDHDFPQRIIYQKTSDKTMLAYIEGIVEGEEQRIEFPYQKVD